MNHAKAGRQLRRTSEQRLALLRNLATSLIESEYIETTEAKAKELRPFVEALITAKSGTLHARRTAMIHSEARRRGQAVPGPGSALRDAQKAGHAHSQDAPPQR